MALIILGITFFGFLVLGVPVAFAIGLASICTILYEGLPLAVLYQQMMSGMNVFSFLAIPFFIFSGELMLHGGVADKIVALAKSAVGHIRGTGRRPDADGPQHDHLRAGSRRRSIDRALIVAGLLPALVLMLCMLAAAYLVAVKRGYPAGTFPGSNAVGRAAIAGVPGLLIIVIILAGILSGVFTATEAAAVAVTYTILLAFLVYRTMTWNHFLEAAAKAVKTTGVVLLLIGRVGDVPVPDGALRACGLHGQPGRDDLDDAVDRVPRHQRDPVCAGNVHGHGGDNPDLHADLLADCNEVRLLPKLILGYKGPGR